MQIALKAGKNVFGYCSWETEGVMMCITPGVAVLLAVAAARRSC